jgi:hypothetical protein
MSDSREPDADRMPDDEELEEPSTEKEPGEEPQDGDAKPDEDDVDHHAVGIGVPDETSDSAPPTDAATG